MPKIVNIPAGAEPVKDPTVDELVQTVAEAHRVFDALLEERRAKRAELSREAFRSYNAKTADQQVTAQEAVAAAEKALSRALKRGEQRVKVGPAKSGEKAGKGGDA
jgi:hypothetical protein